MWLCALRPCHSTHANPTRPCDQAPVLALLRALPMLVDVLLLCAFVFFVFGVVAVQLFAGALRYR